jgi:hypothetical protein
MIDGVNIRDAKPEDLNFLLNSWLKSFKSSKWAGSISDKAYWPAYQETLSELLQRSQVRVAHPTTDEDQILAYIVSEELSGRTVVHYLYTKAVFRRMGLAKALLADVLNTNTFTYTFRTAAARWIPGELHATFDPRIARKKPREAKTDQNRPRNAKPSSDLRSS